jgi:hypothetical protein
MNDKKLGTEPVFPSVQLDSLNGYIQEGISKRLWIATQIFPSLVEYYDDKNDFLKETIEECYRVADELLKQENE